MEASSPEECSFDQVKHRVQNLAEVMLHELEAIKNGFASFPFDVGQIRGVGSLHHS